MDLEEFYKQTTLPNLTENLPKNVPIPQKIGPYQIEALLSKGGMSLLYLGLHPDTHKPLVVKVLSPHFVKNEQMIDQFFKEAKIIEMSNHPNIIKLYGQGQWEQGLYIAMEFIQGVSLKQFILQNSLSTKRSLEILLQVAYALLHLHTHGVIHRDLKPENILITEEGSVKVIDFGIAQLAQDETHPLKFSKGGLIGTPSYMSPEQKKDPLHVSYTADIYALGIISYELLIGKLSFGKIHLSYLPSSLQYLIEKSIAPKIEDRYEDIVEYINAVSLELRSLTKFDSSNIQQKELLATVQSMQKTLRPDRLNHNTTLSIGLAKSKEALDLDLYYDMIKLASGNSLLILAETTTTDLEAITHIAILKGVMQGLLYQYITDDSHSFNLLVFVTSLNELLYNMGQKLHYAFCVLYLEQHQDSFSYLSCGFDSLIHLSADASEPRIINSDNPLLGKELSLNPYESFDRWEQGDHLIIHSFNAKTSSTAQIPDLSRHIETVFTKYNELVTQSKSEYLLDALLELLPEAQDNHANVVISLEKIE